MVKLDHHNDKVWQWLVAGRWFSSGAPVSSFNKTDHHDITEILLKVVLNTITIKIRSRPQWPLLIDRQGTHSDDKSTHGFWPSELKNLYTFQICEIFGIWASFILLFQVLNKVAIMVLIVW
jgi:hypothetical protein